MTELIHDYDRFLDAPEKSVLKDTLRQNLYSRIRQYKDRKRPSLRNRTRMTDTDTPPTGEIHPNADEKEQPMIDPCFTT